MSRIKIVSDGRVRGGGTKVLIDGEPLRGVRSIEILRICADDGSPGMITAKIEILGPELDIDVVVPEFKSAAAIDDEAVKFVKSP